MAYRSRIAAMVLNSNGMDAPKLTKAEAQSIRSKKLWADPKFRKRIIKKQIKLGYRTYPEKIK